MASSSNKKSGSTAKQASVKFAERTTSGRVVSLTRDEEQDMPGDSSPQHGHMNYTVMMPPTPDNTPGEHPDGPGPYGSKARLRTESQRARHGVSFEGEDAERDNRMSAMKNNNKSMLLRTQTNDFDHNRWLFETKGKYGMGNAFWQQDDTYENDAGVSMQDFMDRPWKPLTRKIKISGGVLSPYRVLLCVRLLVLFLFLTWRIRNPNTDAMWLWALSIVCEVWFSISWLLDALPKFNPINRSADLVELKEKFETPSAANPKGRSDLPGIDVFISTVDPEREPPLVTANTILSILAVDYPVEKLSVYLSDDGAAMLTFEAMAETVIFAEVWVPFCRKHNIEIRNPESYFSKKLDPRKHKKKKQDFVKDRRWIKREYDEFKVKVNGLPDVIEKRCKKYNNKENMKSPSKEKQEGELGENSTVSTATWMADGTHWPGVWNSTTDDHKKGDHPGIVQIMSKVPEMEPLMGHADEKKLDFTGVDIRVPMFAYVSREKRPGYDHHKKAGAMNALIRASAILSNGAFILNVDCDHYVYNSSAFREGICYMMDRGGDRVCYVQFPQRFEGIDPSDRYANHNTVFFDGNMRALDGLQGPVYVGTGCLFRRYALYGFEPPRINEYKGSFGQKKVKSQRVPMSPRADDDSHPLTDHPDLIMPQKFGNSTMFNESIEVSEFQGRPLADHFSVKNGRPPGSLIGPRQPLDAPTVAEAIAVISCWYEEKTEWGDRVGWIYGSVTDDVVTGYRMHNRGWRSIYCVTKLDAFRGSAPINLTDRLHQVFIWATGSVEIFFSKNNAFLATTRLKFLQRIAYINLGIYPFTSIFLVVYLFLPALCLFSGQFIVESMDIWFLSFLLILTMLVMLIALLEVKWSGIHLEEFWRNEQFWAIGGSSAHLAAVLRGLLKVIAGVEVSFTVTSKEAVDEDEEDIYADLYVVKWTSLFIVPLTIITVNVIALVIGVSRTIYSVIPEWNKLFCSCLFCFWVLAHMFPFAKGLMGKRGKVPTIIFVWAGLVSITVSLLWVTLTRPDSVAMPGSE